MLKTGDKAPKFSLQGDDGKTHAIGASSEPVVVYFYPKDDTPGCTVEAKDFSAANARFAEKGAKVFGISKDTVASHCKFRDKYGLTVTLLSDPDLAVHTLFGAYGEKNMYGKKVMGTIRSTFVLQSGKVTHAFPSVKVAGHVEAVLASLGGGGEAAPAAAKKAAPKKAAPKKAAAEKAPAKAAKKAAAPKKVSKK